MRFKWEEGLFVAASNGSPAAPWPFVIGSGKKTPVPVLHYCKVSPGFVPRRRQFILIAMFALLGFCSRNIVT
jgi:hypothetical protein